MLIIAEDNMIVMEQNYFFFGKKFHVLFTE